MITAITRQVSASLAQCELTWLDREPIDVDRARAEHDAYEACLERLGVRVISLPPLDEHPDAVFVEDPAIVLDEIAVITTLGVASRRGERASLAAAVAPYRKVLHMCDPARLEGGDVMRIGRTLYVGLSNRTDSAGIEELGRLIRPHGYEVVPVEMKECLHLKSAACFIGEGSVLLNPAWVDGEQFGNRRLIPVDPTEASAANALRVQGTLLLPDCFPKTTARLRDDGFRVETLVMNELMKAESGVTCSSLIFEV